jgi:DNA-binding response OmpR family regulator
MSVFPSEPRLVLLVDDDQRTSKRMAVMLREDGFAVEIARDGAAAIARLARAPVPDALITELNTAHADGNAVSHFARTRNARMPILVVTGYPNLFDAAAFGPEPPLVFTKPVDYATLREALTVALRRSKSEAAASQTMNPPTH